MGSEGDPQRNGSEFGGAEKTVGAELRRLTAESSRVPLSSSLLPEMTPCSDQEGELEVSISALCLHLFVCFMRVWGFRFFVFL